MEGEEAASSYESQESSLLDIPRTINEKNFLLDPNIGTDNTLSLSVDTSVSTRANTGFQSVDFEELPVGTIRGWEPKHCEWTKASNCVSPELLKPCEPSSAWTYEQKDEGEPTLRKSLDRFYETCCQKTPVGGSPAYEAASCYVAAKIAALSDKEGTRYALLSLQIAQMVLSRNANKLFPKPTSSTSFAIPTETSCSLEEGKQIPGLSEDVLQLIVKKNMTNLR